MTLPRIPLAVQQQPSQYQRDNIVQDTTGRAGAAITIPEGQHCPGYHWPCRSSHHNTRGTTLSRIPLAVQEQPSQYQRDNIVQDTTGRAGAAITIPEGQHCPGYHWPCRSSHHNTRGATLSRIPLAVQEQPSQYQRDNIVQDTTGRAGAAITIPEGQHCPGYHWPCRSSHHNTRGATLSRIPLAVQEQPSQYQRDNSVQDTTGRAGAAITIPEGQHCPGYHWPCRSSHHNTRGTTLSRIPLAVQEQPSQYQRANIVQDTTGRAGAAITIPEGQHCPGYHWPCRSSHHNTRGTTLSRIPLAVQEQPSQYQRANIVQDTTGRAGAAITIPEGQHCPGYHWPYRSSHHRGRR